MRFTAREQTGLRAMIALARNFGQGPTALSAIAQGQDLSLPYLEHVAGALRKAGLLGSVRGARGGYFLTRDPAEVSVSDVLAALEGQLVTLECLGPGGPGCERVSTCDVRGIWLRVQECLDQTLGEMMLADVM